MAFIQNLSVKKVAKSDLEWSGSNNTHHYVHMKICWSANNNLKKFPSQMFH